MQTIHETRIHGRGGQGAVTAAILLAEAALRSGYLGSQAIPAIGAERRGAPVRSYVRISKESIQLFEAVINPDVVLVFDEVLLQRSEVLAGLKPRGLLVVNSAFDAQTLRSTYSLPASITLSIINGSDIVYSLGLAKSGIPILNTPMVGAWARATSMITLEQLQTIIANKWSGSLGQRNCQAAKLAFDGLQIIAPSQ